ncbi:MAG: SbcC/MukB-like Walker B domain-containing protein, partial [Dorea sp.]
MAAHNDYQIQRLDMMQSEVKIQEFQDKCVNREETIQLLEKQKKDIEGRQSQLQKEYEEVILRIANSGYANLEAELLALNETLERLGVSKMRWKQTSLRLLEWKEKDVAPNQVLWDIDKFAEGKISEEELERLMEGLRDIQEELEDQRQEADAELRKIKREEKEAREELKALKQGKKAYPRELEEARYELRNRLHEKLGKFVNVQILADMLDIKDERWHNAVEGYFGNNKLLLIVEPEYAKVAIDIYQKMDKKRFSRAAVLDTERLLEDEHPVREGSLAEEVKAKEPYVQAYVNFFLGNVKKCESIEELRDCRIGITPDCVLYHSYRLQHINPENYTRRAYIGETSMRQRIRRLEEKCEKLQAQRLPLQEELEEIRKTMQLEMLHQPVEDYLGWFADVRELSGKERKKQQLVEKMRVLQDESVAAWEKEKKDIQLKQDEKKGILQKVQEEIWTNQKEIEKFKEELIQTESVLAEQSQKLAVYKEAGNYEVYENEFQNYLSGKRSSNYEYLKRQKIAERYPLQEAEEKSYQLLVEKRSSYLRNYPNRTFSTVLKDNKAYDSLLASLECDNLESFKESAKEQARSAVEHFKDDFIFKIRSAIREAYQRKDELNRIISKLDFGKDKYQFVITKNKGADGKYYKMFMDDALQIHPSQLTDSMDNQLNMFTMSHEDQYGDLMNELINIFIPPENATKEELEEAKRNMDKYADYRTYLSFDMQQIVRGDKDMTIGLSKMIKKNSGGEGQNPLYVALLASFAQVYKINLTTKVQRNPTIRLVVLDEAFSKMDAEKVASCISLIRGLGFQAIISATNDKIQNYLENVDKTFVYANPNKKHISIQEFEKQEFDELKPE